MASSLDIGECLQGLKSTYEDNTPEDGNSPTHSPSPQGSYRCVEVEVDPEVIERMSIIEQKILSNLPHDDSDAEPQEPPLHPRKPAVEVDIAEHPHSFPCRDTYTALPSHPKNWPQRPVMVRPTPNTSTKIRGIRLSKSSEYQHFRGFCAGCILPINNGGEANGESLVVDFESTHFVGTLLMRIKQAPPAQDDSTKQEESASYFHGKKRKFQAVVKGRFKTPLPMSQCVTGQSFDRPAGKLPARWIVSSFVKFVSTLAPQLSVAFDGKPRFLAPLVATAHTVFAKPVEEKFNNAKMQESASSTKRRTKTSSSTSFLDYHPHDLEADISEPSSKDESSLLVDVRRDLKDMMKNICDTTKSGTATRMKLRKKTFNTVTSRMSVLPKFALDKEYTFEFYQHLLDFGPDELAVDMGMPIGRVGLSSPTDGQPLKFMSAHRDPETGELDSLWSFDLWHESLYPYAERALTKDENVQ